MKVLGTDDVPGTGKPAQPEQPDQPKPGQDDK